MTIPRLRGVKRFSGNHLKCSAAFHYIIWSRELIEEVEKRLKGGGVRG